MLPEYDIIVVGAGHAGNEAATAAAKLGSKVLVVTMNLNTIGQMSCNPAMGGIAKGQIVREIDALGGMSGIVSDKSMLQFRMLNKSKGPAMWSPRSQNDRMRFAEEWRLTLEKTPNIDFWQDTVSQIIVKDNRVIGVKTFMGMEIKSKAVVLTNGTFLNGLIHIGPKQFGGGRISEKASLNLTQQLVELGFESGRMKTGTPPRMDGRTLDYSKMEEQKGDEHMGRFSFTETPLPEQQKSCYITYTNNRVHKILEKGFSQSPLFNGTIKGQGPRYCPSVEDKINRFADKDRHQIFVEPEGWHTTEVYVNGFSTSLPIDIQHSAIREIAGFENAKMLKPGYAIEYDYFLATQLKLTLETHLIENLYFAGQINGTTGYEEAACQGLVAGINAHRKIAECEPVTFSRTNSYIGVLIDDLTTKETCEPYRMFTSRAEFRILLRQDNADLRLTGIGHKIGLASEERMQKVNEKEAAVAVIIEKFKKFKIHPDQFEPNSERLKTSSIKEPMSLYQLIKRPELDLDSICKLEDSLQNFIAEHSIESIEQAEIQMKYECYIQKEKEMAEKTIRLENCHIPQTIDYFSMKGLSSEAREKLNKLRPATIGQASQISGVSPADVSILMVYLGR